MMTKAMRAFLEAVRTDEDTATGLIAAVGLNPHMRPAEAFVAYAREQGFAVTARDVERLRDAGPADGAGYIGSPVASAGGN